MCWFISSQTLFLNVMFGICRTAREEYIDATSRLRVASGQIDKLNKGYLKTKKVSPDGILQLAIQVRARPIYRSADIYRLITRLAGISYRPFSTDKLSAINKNVLFTILLINPRFFGAFACAVARTCKRENDALERAYTHTQMTTSRTFKFSEYMHINVWNKNMPNNCLRPLTWGNTFGLCNTTNL